MSDVIYMDAHSTTAVDARVLDAMLPYFSEHFGNAASRSHAFGWRAEDAVEEARKQVAALIGGQGKEIVWTSGATESNNLALKGVLHASKSDRAHLITSATEHKAVIDSARRLEREGVEVTWLPVDTEGRVAPDAVAAAIREETALISIMFVNNEVGTVQPIAEIGAIARERDVLFHCDAVQGIGRLPFDAETMGVDLVSLSAHKFYGPKGVGALWVRRRTAGTKKRPQVVAEIDGGGHERGMRSGTLNVPAIVGMGRAAELAAAERVHDHDHALHLRDRLLAGLEARLERMHLNGPRQLRHPGNLNVSFDFVESEALMLALKDVVAVSSGSACTSASLEPSYVLRAMGIDADRAHASIRFGLGRTNTEAEVDVVIEAVAREVDRLRQENPSYRLDERGVNVDW